jgi:hypothetical protein
MDIIGEHRVKDRRPAPGLPEERPVTPWCAEVDPFAQASPVADLSIIAGGLPDPRDADEILRDLASCRMKRARR